MVMIVFLFGIMHEGHRCNYLLLKTHDLAVKEQHVYIGYVTAEESGITQQPVLTDDKRC